MNKHSHDTSSNRLPGRLRQRRLALSLSLALGSLSFCGGALAAVPAVAVGSGPVGGVVVGGNGTIAQNGLNTVINQQSSLLALNWQSFNVGKDATVQFNQPSLNAVALNRILDQNPSQILGRVNSNGQVFLINTHGIIFGATAQLNVGGLMASTLDLTPKDFLAGHFNLDAHGGSAGIVNHGTIVAASGGSVSLIGGKVVNDGLIVANYGRINLDGADRAVLDFDGSGLISVQVTGALEQRLDAGAAVGNAGRLQAEGGTVVLQATAAKDLFTNLVNNSGVIDAHGISTDGGVVRLVGSGGDVINSGSIDASGAHGGSVQLLSDRNVGVMGGGIDASGAAGGGDIRVGGGWQGGEGLPTAQAVYIAPDATLKADATHQGDGGSVVVWGNQANNFYGAISARGGAAGGDGGQVETSAHDGLNAQGRVDASAPAGRAGSWLLDPHDVTLDNSGAGTLGSDASGKYFSATTDSSVIGTSVIEGALVGGTKVSVFTGTDGTQDGNITVASPINSPGQGSLYLKAAGSIFVDSNITGTSGSGPLNLYLWANYGGGATDTAYASRADCPACTVLIGRSGGTVGIDIDRGVLDIRTGDASHAGGLVRFGNGGSARDKSVRAGTFSIHATGIDMGWGDYQFTLLGSAASMTLDAGAGSVDLIDTSPSSSGMSFNGDLSVSGNQVSLGGGSITAKSQSYGGTVTLGADTTLVATDATKAVSLAGSLVGAGNNLAITGNAALGGTISGLDTLAVSGTATLDGDVTTTNAQTYNGAVLLGGAATLTTTDSPIQFASTIDNATSATPGALTVNPGSGLVSFGGAIGGGANGAIGALTLNGSSAVSLGTVNAASLLVGGDATLNGNVTTAGSQAYNGAVLLGGPVTLTTTDSLVQFASTIDNAGATARALTVNHGSGGVSFGGILGGGTNGALGAVTLGGSGVASLGVVNAASLQVGGGATLNGDVTTTGAQIYNGAVLLDGSRTLTTTDSLVQFDGTVDNASSTPAALTVNHGTGTVSFGGAVGGGANGALGDLILGGSGAASLATVNAASLLVGGDATLAGNVTTAGTQTYGGAMLLGGPVTLTTTDSLVKFASTIDNAGATPGALTVDSGSGGTTFGGAIGSGANGAIGDLALDGSGAASLGAVNAASVRVAGDVTFNGNVVTTGAQTYSGAATLAADTALYTTPTGASGDITFGSTVDGPYALTVNTAGVKFFGGAIGGTTALTSLLTGGSGTTGSTILGGNVTTSGSQMYRHALTLASDTTLASTGGSLIYFASTVDGAHALAVNTAGTTDFGGVIGGTTALASLATNAGGSTKLGGNVTTAGTQSYGDAVTLAADAALTSTSTDIIFNSTVEGPHALAVTAAGATGFNGAVGGAPGSTATALTGFGAHSTTFSAAGTFNVNGNLAITATNGGIEPLGALRVTGTSSFTAGNGAVTLADTGNVFTGAVSLTQGGAGDVALFNGSGLLLGDVSVGGGKLSLTSGNGGIAQVGGTTLTQAAGGGAVTLGAKGAVDLSNAGNDFVGTVSATSTAGGVSIQDANDLQIASLGSASGQNVSLVAGGVLSTPAGIDAGTGDLTLVSNDGVLATAGSLTGRNVSLTGRDGVNIDSDLTASGTLDVSSTNGPISQLAGALTVGGDTHVDAGTGAIGLGGANNDFAGIVHLTGGNTQITDSNALTLGNLAVGGLGATSTGALNLGTGTVNGTLAATSGGHAITASGPLGVAGTSTINAGAGTITLTDIGNAFGGAVNLTGGGTQITAGTGGLTLGTLATAALTATTTGALSLAGDGTVGGDLSATGASIAVDGHVTGLSSVAFSGAAPAGSGSLAGTGAITGLGSTTAFKLTGGSKAGEAGGIAFNGFASADATVLTGAAGFDYATKVSEGMAFASATSVTGTGAITGLGGTTFNLTGTTVGTAGATGFSGFGSADTTTVTGAVDFDDGARTSRGMAFANATSVTGSGGITGVAGSFADDTATSSASHIVYSGFGTVAGSGGSVTGVAGRFDLDSKVSTASGIDYSGFNVTTLAGTGTGATIAGSGRSYDLTGADAGSSGTVGWSGFSNLIDALGQVAFHAGGSLGGNLTAQALDYSGYGSAVSFDLSSGSGTSTGIGGHWSGVATVTGTSGSTLTGSGQSYVLTGADAGHSGTLGWTSFGNIVDTTGTVDFGTAGALAGNVTAAALDYGSRVGAVTFDLSNGSGASTGIGGSWSGVASVTGGSGSNTIAGTNQTYTLTGAKAGGNGAVSWTSFGAITDSGVGTITGSGQTYTLSGGNAGTVATWLPGGFSGIGNLVDATGTVDFGTAGALTGNVTAAALDYGSHAGAVTFDLANGGGASTGIGGTWNGVTAVTGNGSSVLTGSTTFALSGPNAGSAGGVGFSGFGSADATTVTGAVGFDDSARTSEGMAFANATSVTGSGGITGVAGSFADDTATSSASHIVYSGFGAVAGSGGSVTGVAGRFDLDSRVSTASGIDYSGFNVTTLAGTGTGATIAGSGRSYDLTGAGVGSSGTVGWSGFSNLIDALGQVAFHAGGSLGGDLTAQALDYSGYGSAVSFDLSRGSGTSTGIGGNWSGVATVAGTSGSTLTGSGQSYVLTGVDAGHSGTLGWTSFGRIADSGGGTISAANQHWALTGHDQGTVGGLSGGFTGIGNLADTGSGYFTMHAGVDGSLSGGLDAGAGGTLDYTGYATPVNVNLAGTGSTGIAGNLQGVGTLLADGALGVAGSSSGPLAITTTGAGATTTLGALAVGADLTVHTDGAVLQGSGPLSVGGTTTLHTAGHTIALDHADNDFVGSVTAEGADIALTDKNDLGIASLAVGANSNLSLIAGGALNVAAGGIDAGSGNLTLAARGGALSTNGALSGNNIALTGNAGLTLGGDVSAANALTLTSNAGAIQQAGGVITADTLSGYAKGGAGLGGANAVVHLGNFTANGFSLNNAQALAVDGTINGGSGAASITTSAGDLNVNGTVLGAAVNLAAARHLVLDATLDSGSGSTTLLAGGNLDETANGAITAGSLSGRAAGAARLLGDNAIAALGDFTAAGFTLANARALDVDGTVDGGAAGTTLTTTAGGLAVNGILGNVAGVTTLQSAGGISQAAGGVVRASILAGRAGGAVALGGANLVGTLGDFSADGFGLNNAQALTVAGAVVGGDAGVALATTAGDLAIGGTLDSGTGNTRLAAAGAIGESGGITAGTLSGRSGGATALTGDNRIGSLGDFTASGFTLDNAGALTVAGTVNGGASTALSTRSGDLRIDGLLSGTLTTLRSAGAIVGGAGAAIAAGTLTGSAVGPTTLGTAGQFMDNRVGTLGGFSSPAGFSFTNAQTLTLAAVGGSAFTVDAGTASLYLGVSGGDLLQQGTAWAYDGAGTWSSTGRIGTLGSPIYVTGVSAQTVARVGRPPAYFYALDATGNILPIAGAPNVNVPTSVLTSRAQNGNNHGDAYIDPGIISANYRSFGIVPSGILLPADQQDCQPGQPNAPGCPESD